MSKLANILNNTAATLYCMGQDWTKGDSSASKVDVIADDSIHQIKSLLTDLTTTHEVLFADHKAYEEFVGIVEREL